MALAWTWSSKESLCSCDVCCCQWPWCCPWPMLCLRAVLMSMDCISIKDHGNVSSLCCYLNPVKGHGSWYDWKPCGYLWSVFLLQVMLVSMTPVIREGCVDVRDLCCHLKPCWYLWTVLPPEAMLTCVWPGLQPEVMLMSMVHCHQGPCLCPCPVVAEGHDVVCGPNYYLRPWGYLWCVLTPEVILMLVSHVVARNPVEIHDLGCHWL